MTSDRYIGTESGEIPAFFMVFSKGIQTHSTRLKTRFLSVLRAFLRE